jgi:hypothetical protein
VDDDELRTGQDVVREVLAALAPGELASVESVVQAYRVRPWTSSREPRGRQVTWAPFVLGFVAEIVTGLAAGDRAGPPGLTGLGRLGALLGAGRRFRNDDLARAPDLPVPAFDEPQLRRVWAAATDAATDHGCSPGDREAFAAAMVAALSAGHLPGPRRLPGA